MVQLADPTTCPECHSEQVARILYGTRFDPDRLERDLAAGRAVLGGNWARHAPLWECQGCHHRWGAAPADPSPALARDRSELRRRIRQLLEPGR